MTICVVDLSDHLIFTPASTDSDTTICGDPSPVTRIPSAGCLPRTTNSDCWVCAGGGPEGNSCGKGSGLGCDVWGVIGEVVGF